ncbi:MAG: HEAT repeat domain-containing protein [Deltaproteobacteria bacterium]|nr:HEAT repeat domain-containing protein [Deltaproteobacteria bacterium]
MSGGPEVLASQRCFGDLLSLDTLGGFEGVRAALAGGLPGDDPLLGDYLRDLLAERIGASPERALEVLRWAESANAGEARLLLEGLARSEGARDLRVAARLVELGARAALDERVRAAALDAVRVQPALEPVDRARLVALALSEESPAAAWHATRALGGVMAERQRLQGEPGPYWDELAHVAASSDDAAVRALALEAPMHADIILPREKIGALLALLPNEPHRDVRELAIFQLGLTDSPRDALEAMRQAFDGEYDECVRAAIVRFSVRAAGEGALPLLEHFARIDPVFLQDLLDYRELFAAGYQDFEQIWLHKAERHACAIEDGEPHGAL